MSNTPLHKWRISAKLNQTEAGKKLGISQAAVSKYERNAGQPSPRLAIKIERITGILREQILPDFDWGRDKAGEARV